MKRHAIRLNGWLPVVRCYIHIGYDEPLLIHIKWLFLLRWQKNRTADAILFHFHLLRKYGTGTK